MRSVAVPSAHRGMSAEELGHAALRIAGCRSLTALRDALFSQADSIIGVVAMGLYLFDGANRLQLISNRLAPLGFLDEYEREFCKSAFISTDRPAGAAAAITISCADGDFITTWAGHSSSTAAPPALFL